MITPSVETETVTQLISMQLAQYGPLPFQLLTVTPWPGKIGIRLSPDDHYCIVKATAFLDWMEQQRPSLDKLRTTLARKCRHQPRSH